MTRKICILTTTSLAIKKFYKGQLEGLSQAGFQVTVVCANDPELEESLPEGIRYYHVPFTRVISPLNDLVALCKLIGFFRKERFDIVQYSTPKASMLASIAAFLSNTPRRIYSVWGLYYMGQKGIKYLIFKFFEKIICRLSHKIIPVSYELIDFAVKEGLDRRQKFQVMLNGSACGIDLNVFDEEKWKPSRSQIRNRFDLPENAIVIGTVARLTGDKGINELVEAFDQLAQKNADVYLLIVGEQEEKDRLSPHTEQIIRENSRIRLAGWQDNPLPFYAAMDIFCLPTYREGFGQANLEAQAMGLPVVSTDVIGPRESVADGITGFLVQTKSAEAVYEALLKLVTSENLRIQMGMHGKERVHQKFSSKDMINAVVRHRLSLLEEKG